MTEGSRSEVADAIEYLENAYSPDKALRRAVNLLLRDHARLKALASRPSPDTSDAVDRQAARLRHNECPRWWQSLSDTHRKALKNGNLSMMDEAFEAGARAAISSLATIRAGVAEEADSGFDGDSVARAEWAWANLPTGTKWTSLATHEKALAVHTFARLADGEKGGGS